MIKSEYRTKALFPDRNAEKSADWLYCPRCVKGNMYAEYEDESVCLQCGYRHYTRSTTCNSLIKKDPAGQGGEQIAGRESAISTHRDYLQNEGTGK